MGRRLGLSTLVVILSLLFWGWAWGPLGALLSVPLTVVVKIWLENTHDLRWVAILLDKAPPRAVAAGPAGGRRRPRRLTPANRRTSDRLKRMPRIDFDALPDHGRVWVFPATAPSRPTRPRACSRRWTPSWTGGPPTARPSARAGRCAEGTFLLVGVDEDASAAVGVLHRRAGEPAGGAGRRRWASTLVDHAPVWYRDGDEVRVGVPRGVPRPGAATGAVDVGHAGVRHDAHPPRRAAGATGWSGRPGRAGTAGRSSRAEQAGRGSRDGHACVRAARRGHRRRAPPSEQEARALLVRPEARAPRRALQEAHVAAPGGQDRVQRGVGLEGGPGDGRGGEEGVVQAVEDQRGHPDPARGTGAAAAA